MAPNPRVTAAYRAMKSIGIQEVKVKPVLKKLLKLYEKNWELIEEENYRALADAVFEEEENQLPKQTKNDKNINVGNTHDSLLLRLICIPFSILFLLLLIRLPGSENKQEEDMEDEDPQLPDEPVRPLKRLRLRGQDSPDSQPVTRGSPSCVASPLKRPKFEDDGSPEKSLRQKPQNIAVSSQSTGNARTERCPVAPQDGIVDKGKQPVSPSIPPRERGLISKRPSLALTSKESEVGSGNLLLPKNKMLDSHALIKPKDEPIDELPDYEVPIRVIPPEEPSTGRGAPMINDADRKQKGPHSLESRCRDKVKGKDIHTLPNEKDASSEDATIQGEGYSNVEIASSPLGEVKIYLSCCSALGGSDFRLPSREQLMKVMEDKCLQSYHISDPKFSLMNLLRDMCHCILELGTDSDNGSNEGSMQIIPSVNGLDECRENDTLTVRGNKVLGVLPLALNGSIDVQGSVALVSPQVPIKLSSLSGLHDALNVANKVRTDDVSVSDDKKELEDPVSPNSGGLVIVPQHQLSPDDLRSLHDANDLTKGEESVKIPWINKSTNDFPPYFYYIPGNLVFCNAYLNMSLAHIGDEDCCSACLGNCLLSSTPCGCANKAGGGFAYTLEGLVKDEFLEECIAISHNREQHHFYCKDCPLERSRNDDCLEPCKGHLKRRFIKECWIKCGCGKQCGNRIVQRGITCNLQVFLTTEGKGWGLRTVDDLPKGAFVCEFVGEILTIAELWKRNMQCTQNEKHTYPILLDSGWDSGNVKDNEALSLDAASYGNIARFINHRCMDANLVGIPVEVETPDHHYYHFAFFTSRKVAALEELTWDYGIDFDDHEHPMQPFHCRCGSKFCRNMKRPNRSTRSASMIS